MNVRMAIRGVVGVVASLALAAGGAGPAVAQSSGAVPSGSEIRVGATYEESTLIGVTGDLVSPYLFDPIDSFQCEVIHNADHMIVEMDTWPITTPSGGYLWSGGDTDLRCGTEQTSGWWHIQSRHQKSTAAHPNSWETIRDSASAVLGYETYFSWDDFMWMAVQDMFTYPMETSYEGNDKVCISNTFSIWKDDVPVYTFWVNTIASRNNLLIISAYPSDIMYLSDCYD